MLAWPGAVEAGWPDEGVAAHYGDPMREQRATEESAGVVDEEAAELRHRITDDGTLGSHHAHGPLG